MNCRACHLVDEHAATPRGGNRTYADFGRRSPLPALEDGRTTTARNSPPLVNAILPRTPLLLHFDGEFTTLEDLVRETLLGRNFGWLAWERPLALAHVARVIRGDDGQGNLAREFGRAYRVVLKGIDSSIPAALRCPPQFRLDVARVSDADQGQFAGSPYDAFLRKNGLPRRPNPGESDLA